MKIKTVRSMSDQHMRVKAIIKKIHTIKTILQN
jgi:hypothetical protein